MVKFVKRVPNILVDYGFIRGTFVVNRYWYGYSYVGPEQESHNGSARAKPTVVT